MKVYIKIIIAAVAVLIVSAGINTCYAQVDYRELFSNAIFVKEGTDYVEFFTTVLTDKNDYYYEDRVRASQVINVLKKDIISYYGLWEKYDTELKRKVFLSSQEAKGLQSELEKLSNDIMKYDYCFLHDFMDSYGYYKFAKYNLSTQRFDIRHFEMSCKDGYIGYGYSRQGQLYLSIPKTVEIKMMGRGTRLNMEGYNMDGFSIPLKNETMALEIEENLEDCALMMVFNIEKTMKRIYRGNKEEDVIIGKTKYAYIVNKKTGRIYSDNPDIRERERQFEIQRAEAEALQIEAEMREQQAREQEARELEQRYQNAVSSAQSNFEQQKYAQAKRNYQTALAFKPENAASINPKIAEIDMMLRFLNERKRTTYDYTDYYASDYETINSRVLSEIKEILFDASGLSSSRITITSVIDTSGIVSTSVSTSISNTALKNKITQIADNIKLKQPAMNGYTVSARAVFVYSVSAEEAIIDVKKTGSKITSKDYAYDKYQSEISNSLSSKPKGKYTIQYNRVTINGTPYMREVIKPK